MVSTDYTGYITGRGDNIDVQGIQTMKNKIEIYLILLVGMVVISYGIIVCNRYGLL